MSMKIRLARGGSKKRPHYAIVATDSRNPRDGRFLEKLGTYDPMLDKDNEGRVKMDLDRIKHWLSQGAQPTDRLVHGFGSGTLDHPQESPENGCPS